MNFVFTDAARSAIALKLAIAGPSNAGKTNSAHRLARGIAGPTGEVYVIDTENRRSLQYAPPRGKPAKSPDTFRFKHTDLQPPFNLDRYLAAHRACVEAGAAVVIIDSGSHVWDGEGGVQDEHDRKAELLHKKGVPEAAAKLISWQHKHDYKRDLQRWVRSLTVHTIWLLRAAPRVRFDEVVENGRKKTVVTPLGFQPICESSFMFDMDAAFTLHPDAPGKINPDVGFYKVVTGLKPILRTGELVTEEMGGKVAAWASEGGERDDRDRASEGAQALIDRVQDAVSADDTKAALAAILSDPGTIKQREWLRSKRPDLADTLEAAILSVERVIASVDAADAA